MTTDTKPKAVGRPSRPPERAEAEALQRIATLASHILRVLRDHGGSYESENTLRAWMQEAGVSFTTAEIRPGLDLLESMGMLVRAAVGRNSSRSGRIPDSPVNVSERPAEPVVDVLIKALSSGRCDSEDALQDRLIGAGVQVEPDDLDVALTRLVDSGRLMRLKSRPSAENPNPPRGLVLANFPAGYSHNGQGPFDEVDALAADVHASIKKRGDSFEGDQQLEVWLAEDGINTTPELLRDAVLQLEISGWLSRPYREHEWSRGPLPGYLVSPSWARDWY